MRSRSSRAPHPRGRRLSRSNRGVASAIATTFTILIMTFMFAQYLADTFPNQMQAAEQQHTIQAETQFETLQSNINLEVEHPGNHVSVTTPVALSGQGVPPFGPPAGSILKQDAANADNATLGIQVTTGTSSGPTWNTANMCGGGSPPNWDNCNAGGSGSSPSNCGPHSGTGTGWNYINYNLSYMDLEGHAWQVGGSQDCVFLNISGSHNDIEIKLGGSHEVVTLIEVEGNYNFIDLNIGGSATYGNFVYLFGQHNTYNLTAGGSSLNVNTYFVGYNPAALSCPFQSLANTDAFNILSAGGTNILQNLTWYYATPPPSSTAYHLTGMPGGGVTDQLGWQNVTGPGTISCAFQQQVTTTYTEQYVAGLSDTLQNRYSAGATLDYEEGAVILGSQGGSSMLSGPLITVNPTGNGGYTVALTLVQFLPVNMTTQAGYGTAGVKTWLVSESTAVLVGASSATASLSQFLNITTLYPQAWVTWAAEYPTVMTGGGTISQCHAIGGSLPSCSVYIPIADSQVSLTLATVAITLVG